eukprot:Amastigsp_a676462_139.p2 type:complete len:114 gc:universal Amastigsp_a676462_139:410-751(+)
MGVRAVRAVCQGMAMLNRCGASGSQREWPARAFARFLSRSLILPGGACGSGLGIAPLATEVLLERASEGKTPRRPGGAGDLDRTRGVPPPAVSLGTHVHKTPLVLAAFMASYL